MTSASYMGHISKPFLFLTFRTYNIHELSLQPKIQQFKKSEKQQQQQQSSLLLLKRERERERQVWLVEKNKKE